MSKVARKRRVNDDDGPELDISKARLIGRGIHARRGVRMSLRALRTALSITQIELSERTEIAQGDLSRLEQRATLDEFQIGTLRRYVEGLGGKLEIVAMFPSGHRFTLAGAGGGRD